MKHTIYHVVWGTWRTWVGSRALRSPYVTSFLSSFLQDSAEGVISTSSLRQSSMYLWWGTGHWGHRSALKVHGGVWKRSDRVVTITISLTTEPLPKRAPVGCLIAELAAWCHRIWWRHRIRWRRRVVEVEGTRGLVCAGFRRRWSGDGKDSGPRRLLLRLLLLQLPFESPEYRSQSRRMAMTSAAGPWKTAGTEGGRSSTETPP